VLVPLAPLVLLAALMQVVLGAELGGERGEEGAKKLPRARRTSTALEHVHAPGEQYVSTEPVDGAVSERALRAACRG
jgi:hypothetical protein